MPNLIWVPMSSGKPTPGTIPAINENFDAISIGLDNGEFMQAGPGIELDGQEISVDMAYDFTWTGEHEFRNLVQITNPTRGGASGFEFTTDVSGTPGDGVEVQMAMWEDDIRTYGFRFLLDGTEPAAGDLVLFQHDNDATGIEVFRISRSEPQLQLQDGDTTYPSLGFADDRDLGLYRVGDDQLGINALTSVVHRSNGSGTGFITYNLNASSTGGYSIGDETGTSQVRFGYSNSSNRPFINVDPVADMTFQQGGTVKWEFLATSGYWLGRDDVELQLGTGGDLRLWHDGTNSNIRNNTGNLSVNSNGTEVLRIISGSNARLHGLNGTAALPTFGWFGDTDNGMYYISSNTFGFSAGGTLRLTIDTTAFTATLPWRGQNGSATAPAFSFSSDTNLGAYRVGADQFGIAANDTLVAQFDADATAGNTRFMVYDVDNATLERVSVGAADSGGSGYKVLRIPN